MKRESLAGIFGWIGIVLILLAYFLVSYKFVLGDSLIYQAINFFGASGAFYNSYFKKSKPLMTLQLVWGIIALISIVKIYI
ncbi:hypothetical protein COU58_03450 [Candidatus Pacearchaeota archaeon CG10_big_fil_rev_8_21_14_0_10_32_42]|nr:MAG: hypothetical protein COU58_03450 [Candidatus Pacearchaeota archaeon CG10_big_fil_rev_8_21_14_0_10_32_42]